jgi:transposase-like protein
MPELPGRGSDDAVTKPFAPAFKGKMVQRLIGKNAISARKLEQEIGVPQTTLSRWLEEARSLPRDPPPSVTARKEVRSNQSSGLPTKFVHASTHPAAAR